MLKKYLYRNLSASFFPIFLTLFSITSIIFLVQIASLTSIIQLNLLELVILYSYTIPKILFFTLPISFFIGLVMTLSKLSGEYELLVISSFGKNPLSLLRYFFPITLLLSITLIIISEILIPKAHYLNKKFISLKQNQAQLNIKASQFGQEFGSWLIFIEEEDKDKLLHNIILLNKDITNQKFIIANTATMVNDSGNLKLELYDGKSFILNKTKIDQINYETMALINEQKQLKYNSFTSIIHNWKQLINNKDDASDFIFNLLFSLFPLISLFYIIIFGYYNPRYEKNKATLYSSILIVIFFIITKKLVVINPFVFLIAFPTIWIAVSYILYTQTVKKRY